ncbi:hypothetical protein BJ165DRAFT_759465 [Panaeolus papilionaceus]|nr:hypothetical protein BJ165DRAFT_759465 [Panaeolus papilionaceus]
MTSQQTSSQTDSLEWQLDISGFPRFHVVEDLSTNDTAVISSRGVITNHNFDVLQDPLTTQELANLKLWFTIGDPDANEPDGDFCKAKEKVDDLIERFNLPRNEWGEVNTRSLFIPRRNSHDLKVQHPFTGTRYNNSGNRQYWHWAKGLESPDLLRYIFSVRPDNSFYGRPQNRSINPMRALDANGKVILPQEYSQKLAIGTPVGANFHLLKFVFSNSPIHAFVAYLAEIQVLEEFGTSANPYPSGEPTIVKPPRIPGSIIRQRQEIPVPHCNKNPSQAPLSTPSKAYASPPPTPVKNENVVRTPESPSPTPRQKAVKSEEERDIKSILQSIPVARYEAPSLKRRYPTPELDSDEDTGPQTCPQSTAKKQCTRAWAR